MEAPSLSRAALNKTSFPGGNVTCSVRANLFSRRAASCNLCGRVGHGKSVPKAAKGAAKGRAAVDRAIATEARCRASGVLVGCKLQVVQLI